jgi:hypothetical protein
MPSALCVLLSGGCLFLAGIAIKCRSPSESVAIRARNIADSFSIPHDSAFSIPDDSAFSIPDNFPFADSRCVAAGFADADASSTTGCPAAATRSSSHRSRSRGTTDANEFG